MSGASAVSLAQASATGADDGRQTAWYDIAGIKLAITVAPEFVDHLLSEWLYTDFRIGRPEGAVDSEVTITATSDRSVAPWMMQIKDLSGLFDEWLRQCCDWGGLGWVQVESAQYLASMAAMDDVRRQLSSLGYDTMLAALRRDGYAGLHAAALSQRGAGLVLSGNGQTGKTTLALGLAARGWSLLGEDVCIVRPPSTLLPYPLQANLRRGGYELLASSFPNLFARYRSAFAGQERVLISTRDLFPTAGLEPCRSAWIILLDGYCPEDRPQLQPILRTEAVIRLASRIKLFADDPAEWLSRAADLVSEAQCFRLRAGKLADTLDLLEERLTR